MASLAMDELVLEEWDPATMPDDCCCLMVGARHSGKSVLLTDIMYHKRKRLDLVMGMNPTEEANETLAQFTPPGFIYDEYNNKAVKDLMEWQKRCRAHDKRGKGVPGYKSKTCKVGLVLDDCMAEKCTDESGKKKKKVMQSDDIERVFKLGRHFKLFFICAMQYIKDAPPAIRGNVDYVFVFDTNSGSEKEKLWKEYFNMFTYKDFCKVFAACVGEKYNCIVLDVRKSRGAPGQGIYFYRAEDRTTKAGGSAFKVGRSIFWNLAEYYYVDRADIDLDPAKIRGIGADVVAKKSSATAPAPILHKSKGKPELIVRRKTVDPKDSRSKDRDRSKDKDKDKDRTSREVRRRDHAELRLYAG